MPYICQISEVYFEDFDEVCLEYHHRKCWASDLNKFFPVYRGSMNKVTISYMKIFPRVWHALL